MEEQPRTFGGEVHRYRVLFVEDNEVLGHHLCGRMDAQPELQVVGKVRTVAAALALLRGGLKPDLAIVDIYLPGGRNGIELIAELHQQYPAVAPVAFTGALDERLVEAALLAGARGFLRKPVTVETIVAMAHRVVVGDFYFDDDMLQLLYRLLPVWASVLGKVLPAAPVALEDLFSPSEEEVFSELGAGHTRGQIARRSGRSPKTIDTLIDRCKAKCRVHTTGELEKLAKSWVRSGRGK